MGRPSRNHETMDDLDKRILTAIQSDLPVTERPFDVLAARLEVDADGPSVTAFFAYR